MDESYSHWPTAACRGGGSRSGRTTAGLPPCRTRGEGLAAPLGRRGPEERAAPAVMGTARRTRTSPTYGGADGGVPRRRKPEWKDDAWPPAMSDPWGGPGGASGKKRAGGEGGSSGDGHGEREG